MVGKEQCWLVVLIEVVDGEAAAIEVHYVGVVDIEIHYVGVTDIEVSHVKAMTILWASIEWHLKALIDAVVEIGGILRGAEAILRSNGPWSGGETILRVAEVILMSDCIRIGEILKGKRTILKAGILKLAAMVRLEIVDPGVVAEHHGSALPVS